MSNYCIFCTGTGTPNIKDYSISKRFVELINRYSKRVLSEESGLHYPFLIDQAISAGMIVCEKCGVIMKLFCDQYNQLEIVKLRLNWSIQRFKERLEGDGSKRNDFGEKVETLKVDRTYWLNEGELIEMVKDLKRDLLEQCNQKLRNSLPRLSLKPCYSGGFQESVELGPASTSVSRDTVSNEDEEEGMPELSKADLTGTICQDLNQEMPALTSEHDHHVKFTEPKPSSNSVFAPEYRKLRAVHRCKNCKKTFSSLARLSSHSTECKQELTSHTEEETDDELSGSDSGELFSDDYEEDDDVKNANFSSDTSTESEDEVKFNINNSGLAPLKSQPFRKCSANKSTNYRFKCPFCDYIFLHLHEVILHCKAKHPQSQTTPIGNSTPKNFKELQDQTYSVPIVKFYIKPKLGISLLNITWTKTYKIVAKINVPQDVLFCPEATCGESFYAADELKIHSKIHGEFKCISCEFVEASAEKLARHELVHGKHIKYEDSVIKGEGKSYNTLQCARCDLEFFKMEEYLNHHLTQHLSLPPRQSQKCAICRICTSDTNTDEDFEHYITHHNMDSYKVQYLKFCQFKDCHAYFVSSRRYLDAHNEQVHIQKVKNTSYRCYRYKCPGCKKKFHKVHMLLRHFNKFHPKSENGSEMLNVNLLRRSDLKSKYEKYGIIQITSEVYICSGNCGQAFYSEEDFENHKKLHGKFNCSYCSFEAEYAPDIAEHELLHCGEPGLNKFKCPCCEYECHLQKKQLYIWHYLSQHLKLMPTINHTCPICRINCGRFEGQGTVKLFEHYKQNHDLTVKTESILKCEIERCSAYFTNPFGLTTHKNKAHSNLSQLASTVKCSECGKAFSGIRRNPRLHAHRVKYHPDKIKRIPCKYAKCSFVGESQEDLTWHEKYAHHRKINLLLDECPKCQKRYAKGGPMTAHLKSHVPKQPPKHICELCGKRFKENGYLQVHKLSHSGPESWAFSCDICSKRCFSKQKLDEHLRTHSKDKPFVCDICGIKYAHRHNLRIHINNKHGDLKKDVARKFNWRNSVQKVGKSKK